MNPLSIPASGRAIRALEIRIGTFKGGRAHLCRVCIKRGGEALSA